MQINNFSEIPDEVIEIYVIDKLRAIDLNANDLFTDLKSLQPKVFELIYSPEISLKLQVVKSVSMALRNFGEEETSYHWVLDGSPYKLAARCYVGFDSLSDAEKKILQKLPDFIACYYQHSDGLLLTDDEEMLSSGLGLPNSLGDFRNLRDFLIENSYQEDVFDIVNQKIDGIDLRVISVGTDGSFCIYDLGKSKSNVICVTKNGKEIDMNIIEDAEKADEYYAEQLLNWKSR